MPPDADPDDGGLLKAPLGAVRVAPDRAALAGHAFAGFAATWFDWADAAGGAPAWRLFDPVDHPALLPYVVAHRIAADGVEVRLAGDAVETMVGFSLRGLRVEPAHFGANAAVMIAQIDAAHAATRPSFVRKTLDWRMGRGHVRYDVLTFPFHDADGAPTRSLSLVRFVDLHP